MFSNFWVEMFILSEKKFLDTLDSPNRCTSRILFMSIQKQNCWFNPDQGLGCHLASAGLVHNKKNIFGSMLMMEQDMRTKQTRHVTFY